MKNKKMLFGAIILLFAITGICNIPNVSAQETIQIPPLSYAYYYMGYLENRDEILINEIYCLAGINVYIMNEEQFDTLQHSSGTIWTYIIRWEDVYWMTDRSIEIIENDYYYVVLYNKHTFSWRTVDVDISVRYYTPPVKSKLIFGWLGFIISAIIIGVIIVIPIVLIRKHKRKIPKEDIKPESPEVQEKQIPKVTYCPECGTEILDKSRKFCSVCGAKIIK